MRRTRVVEIAGADIHQELAELAELPGFRLVSMEVSEWATMNHKPNYYEPRLEPVRWLVVYEVEA